ncbi:diguanylate cyclase/phosphodiesterase (GGDEF & EAL domains) with PAS/PAC sensor(s) [Rhodovulum sp. P5]|uniref:EAL domain-containing protein n=1 Tax=Rhodovulum sp. P5 TaxID=1564506 RepID=UPI0009C2DB81|nr:EAL domain-containing protein [Rhodovulum sp. P5]ARE38374.1 diguanylate cyclase/phosphodiesterase (GGDEF & EAL domains) with PAS/PAC sensor(s) [Rhodovulum sp. P5]
MQSRILGKIIIAVILSAILGGGAALLRYQHAWDASLSALRTDTHRVTDHVELLARSQYLAAETVADSLEPDELATSGQSSMEEVWGQHSGLKGILVIDATGKVVSGISDTGNVRGIDMSDRAYFRVHLDGNADAFYMGAPVFSRTDGSWLLPVSVPIREVEGPFAGIVVVGTKQEYFAHLTHDVSNEESLIFLRIRENGAVLYLNDPTHAPEVTAGVSAALDQGAVQQADLKADARPLEVAGAMAFVRESPYGLFDVVVLRPQASLERAALFAGLAHGGTVFALFASVLTAAIAFWWASSRARLATERSDTLEERLQLATRAAEIGVWDLDLATGYLNWNDTMHLLFGLEPGSFDGSFATFRTLLHPDEVDRIETHFATAIQSLDDFDEEFRIVTPEGEARVLKARASVFADRDGNAVRVIGVTYDVTDQKAAEQRAADAAEELRRGNERFLNMAENAPGAIFENHMTPEGEISVKFLSSTLMDLMGVERADVEAKGSNLFARIPASEIEPLIAEIMRCAANLERFEVRHRVDHPVKGMRWVMVAAEPKPQPDGMIIWYGSVVDITERLEIETRAAEAAEETRIALERLSSVSEIAPVGLYEYLWYGPGDIDFTYTSARFEDLWGYTRSELRILRSDFLQRMHPDDLVGYRDGITESSRSLTPRNLRFRIQHPTHGLRWLATQATPRKDKTGTVIWTGALLDVTDDVRREEELREAHRTAEEMRARNERQALHDGLTGLPNRRYYDRMIAERRALAAGDGPADCALVRIDLDHFKYVNDTLGHEAGDLVLVRVADVLRDCLRASDFAARIGGDEFSILLAPGSSEADTTALVDRIREQIAEPVIHDGRPCRFGASFGIAHTDDLVAMGDDIQMFADAALYRAKESGRSRLELFTPELHSEILTDRRLAVEIHEGLDNDQFVPFFQPQVSAEGGQLVGVETLLRWNHPVEGLMAPDSFMHVADHLRLVPDIDRLMMEKSRDALARWRAQGLKIPKISFNVSSGRMHDPDVVALASEMAAGETRVTFELLESILVEEENDTFRMHLDMIRDAGIDIEIDDFGSGHASIIGVMEIGPSALKIDKRIVLPVEDDLRARNLVRAIVEIAETLGIGTVAEGVETEGQAAILRGIGCSVLQGYLFSRPLDEDAFLDFARGAARQSA